MNFSTGEPTTETIDHQTLFGLLSSGLVLVTGNSRLARVLDAQFNEWRIGRGDRQWHSPAIRSWDAWLAELWSDAGLLGIEGSGRAVPASQQLLSLWESVLRDDPQARQILHPETLAARLRDTRKLAVDWRLDFDHPAWRGSENENHAAFQRWNQAFDTRCQRDNWIAPEDRTQVLSRAIRQARLMPPMRVGLLGFDEFNPAQMDLIAALGEAGISVTALEISPAKSNAVLWRGISDKEELQGMARWVRHCLDSDPDSRIAIVVPNLQMRRQEVERHLAEILTPGRDGADGTAKPWNISLGVPLARAPMIRSAFDLLRLLERRVDIQDIGKVLRSPWISGGDAERNKRALLEKCLRDNYPRQLKMGEVWYRAREIRKYGHDREKLPVAQREPQPWNSPMLVTVLDRLAQFDRDTRSARKPSAWAEAFGRLLTGLGWPLGGESPEAGGTAEHEENWQTYEAWQDSLRELAFLDVTTARLHRNAAISRLHRICQERVFQPRTPPSNIQVLGLYEVSGLRFDHLWVLGLHNDNWPPSAQPNPFIPGLLQQSAGLPQSSPERELEVARTITRRLLETAGNCVFSYPGQSEGEAVLPSPLLDVARIASAGQPPGWDGDSWLGRVGDAGQPGIGPLQMPGPLERDTARGGASILKHQALCPFRAFASNRLGAESLATPVDGISPMLHGSLLHRVLEIFWKETRSLENLLLLDEDQLDARIRRHVDEVVNEERSLNDRPEFRDVEGARLARLAISHLELEKTRGPFEVVGFEREIRQEIEGQEIRLIIDRIDRLPSGDEVIIDYKTGKVDPKKWFGDRPEDPQLPLYAISAESCPAAVVFTVLRDDECLYRGVVSEAGIFPGLPPRPGPHGNDIIAAGLNMPATIADWRRVLHRLMSDFLAGRAAIDPRDGRRTCDVSYCEMQPLCRIGELEAMQPSNDPEPSA